MVLASPLRLGLAALLLVAGSLEGTRDEGLGLGALGHDVLEYRLEGEWAVAFHGEGGRRVSGHFERLGGSLVSQESLEGGRLIGRLTLPMAAWRWQGKEGAAIQGGMQEHFFTVQVKEVSGVHGDAALGVTTQGRFFALMRLGEREEEVDIPVSIVRVGEARFVIQPLGAVDLGRSPFFYSLYSIQNEGAVSFTRLYFRLLLIGPLSTSG